ncbi:MAG TPA: RidA family protein [Gemmatimonadaceae bacterium]|jgi:2-iminobutanoate/2-iminopropanoate deaminase
MRSAALAALLVAVAAPIAAAQRQVIVPQGQNASKLLSPAIRYGDVVYLSGAMGLDRANPDTTIGGQTKRALENLQKVAQAAGTNMSNATKCTVFLTDLKDFAGMNAAYSEFFPKEPPGRSTVVVAALVTAGAKVEIECIVGMPK